MTGKRLRRVCAAAAVIAVSVLTVRLASALTPQELRDMLAPLGMWAPAAYIALFTLLPVFFFPVPVLALAGGLLFGLCLGSLYTFIGALLNCSLMFFIARFAGRESVSRFVNARLSPQWRQRLKSSEGRKGLLLLIILRLIPAVPYNMINYAFGLTDMRWRTYLLGSAAGIIPGTLAFINIGDKAPEPNSPSFWLALVLLGALLLITVMLGKKIFPDSNDRS